MAKTTEKKKDFQSEYNRLSKEKEEQLKAGSFAQYNIDNTINMILIPFYNGQATMQAQQIYERSDWGSEAYNNYIESTMTVVKGYITNYVSDRKSLALRRPTHNPEDPGWTLVENDLAFINKEYPEIEQDIGQYVTNLIEAAKKYDEVCKELEELIKDPQPAEEPEPNISQQMSNVEDQVDKQVTELTTTPDPEGHTYPVAMVKSWTNELKGYNKQIDSYLKMFKEINLDFVDRDWLRKQVQKFVDWLMLQLQKLKKKIVSALKGMMKPIKKALSLIKPIIEPPSLDTIVSWAMAVLNVFMEPYMKVIQFISDFATYTPPLISEAATLASKVPTVPGTIIGKVSQLQGEGASIIQDEISNAVTGVTFSPPSMGDVM